MNVGQADKKTLTNCVWRRKAQWGFEHMQIISLVTYSSKNEIPERAFSVGASYSVDMWLKRS